MLPFSVKFQLEELMSDHMLNKVYRWTYKSVCLVTNKSGKGKREFEIRNSNEALFYQVPSTYNSIL